MTQAKFFPVAGCPGTDHRLAGDYHHRWMVIDAQGEWLTAQACPTLSEVTVDLKMGALVLRAPGMLRMDIPLDVIEDDDSVNNPFGPKGKPFDWFKFFLCLLRSGRDT